MPIAEIELNVTIDRNIDMAAYANKDENKLFFVSNKSIGMNNINPVGKTTVILYEWITFAGYEYNASKDEFNFNYGIAKNIIFKKIRNLTDDTFVAKVIWLKE